MDVSAFRHSGVTSRPLIPSTDTALCCAVPRAGVGGADGRQPKTLVFFLGGCTYAEIAAIRFLGSLIGREFTIATTNMLNGTTMLVSAGTALCCVGVLSHGTTRNLSP